MILIKLAILFSIVMSLGWLLLMFWPRMKLLESLAIAWALGGVMISWQLFLIKFYFRLNLDVRFIWLIVFEILVLYWWHKKNSHLYFPEISSFGQFKIPEALLIFGLALLVVMSLTHVWSLPTINYDALAVWAMRVKVLAYGQSGFFDPDSFMYWKFLAHANYPWHLPLLGWFGITVLGDYYETWLNIVPWTSYIFLLLTSYIIARAKLDRPWSLVISFLIGIMPLVFYHGYNFYADLSLSYYLAVLVLVWHKWLGSSHRSWLILSGVIAASALTIKSDALIFVILMSLLTMIKLFSHRKFKDFLIFIAPVVLISAPWFIWLRWQGLGIRNVPPGLAWHPEVWRNFLVTFFVSQNWHLWWYFFVIAVFLGLRQAWKQVEFRYLFCYFVLVFTAILGIYFTTEAYRYALGNEALSRNIILLVPFSLIILVYCLEAWQKHHKP